MYIKSPRCLKCGKQIDDANEEYCVDCKKTRHIYTRGIGVWGYSEGIRQSIYEFKYHGMKEYAKFYGKEIASGYGEIIREWNADVIIPIPLHSSKLRKRGYNQAELVALDVGARLGIPVDAKTLLRREKTKPQKDLSERERIKNLKNAFILTQNVVKYKKIILVDDIYTTGTTIDACADLLLQAGVEKVYFLSVCIGRGF